MGNRINKWFIIEKTDLMKLYYGKKPNPDGKGHGSEYISLANHEKEQLLKKVLKFPLFPKRKVSKERPWLCPCENWDVCDDCIYKEKRKRK